MRSIREIKTILTNGDLDEKLAYLYCRKKDEIQPFRDRVFHIIEGYQKTFEKDDSAQASVFSAPGRTEIGGNHTDHQRGKVLTGSVDLDALACAGRNGTKTVNIFSEGYGLISIDIADLAPVKMEENTTYAIIRGMVAKIASLGYSAGGFDAYVISDVPGGSGLSSSACFEVLLGTLTCTAEMY